MNLDSGKRAPVIRFKDDRDKEYPKWETKKLADIGKFVGGGTPDTTVNSYWKGDIPWITSADINEGDIHNIKIHRYISEDAVRKSATNVLPPNSVIFASRVGIGKVVISNFGICISQDFTGLVLETEDLNIFIAYQFQSNKNLLIRFSQGTSIKGYTSKDLKGISIFLPVEKEQQKIANFLSSVDTRIEQLEKKKALLEQYKKGLMQKLFSQEIRFKDDQGEEYPEWEDEFLEAVSTIVMGTSPSSLAYNKEHIGLPLIQGNADIENRKSAPRIYTSIITKECNPEDILLSVRAPVGEISVSTHTACIGRGIAAIRAKEKISQGFLYQMLIWFEPKWRFFSQGSTFDSINSKDLKSLRLAIPYFEEQQKIASFLSSVDRKIELIAEKIIKTRDFKKGLLQQMFV